MRPSESIRRFERSSVQALVLFDFTQALAAKSPFLSECIQNAKPCDVRTALKPAEQSTDSARLIDGNERREVDSSYRVSLYLCVYPFIHLCVYASMRLSVHPALLAGAK